MDFKLTEEQQMLQDTAARLVRDAYPFEQREKFSESELGFSTEFWGQLGELGLTAVPFAEEIGGFGGGGVETMLVMTELGRGLTLEPYLQSVIFGGGLLNQLGGDAQKEDLLPQVAAAMCDAHAGLEIQIVALPRVFNLSKREADFAVAVSPPQSGRLVVQRLCDYHLHLAAHGDYLADAPPLESLADLRRHHLIGYIPDMIFDPELDYLAPLLKGSGAGGARLTSNSVSVQMQAIRGRAGIGIVHDFALPFTPDVGRVLTDEFSLTRSFWLIRHADDRRSERLNRLADDLAHRLRAEVARLETAAPTIAKA